MDVLENFEIRDLSHLVRQRGDSRPAVVTIGNFDGLHQGHRLILDGVVERSRELEGQSVVVTFHPHPQKVLHPERAPSLIMTRERKIQLLQLLGIDYLVIIPFSRDFATRSAEDFVKRVLVEALGAVEVHIGSNFTFGRGKEGNHDFLAEMGVKHGFRAVDVKEVVVEGEVVSSSRIRRKIREGRVMEAGELLGYPFHITGRIIHGRARGRLLNFPTANLLHDGEILPRWGVYLSRFEMQGNTFSGMTNVGVKPTFDDQDLTVETFLLDFDGDIYDETARLFFLKRVRDEIRFPDSAALCRQLENDLEVARRFFGFTEPLHTGQIAGPTGRDTY